MKAIMLSKVNGGGVEYSLYKVIMTFCRTKGGRIC